MIPGGAQRSRTVKCWRGFVLEWFCFGTAPLENGLVLEGHGFCTLEAFGGARYERSRLIPGRVKR